MSDITTSSSIFAGRDEDVNSDKDGEESPSLPTSPVLREGESNRCVRSKNKPFAKGSLPATDGNGQKNGGDCGAAVRTADTTSNNQNKSIKSTDSKIVVLGSSGVGKSALVVRFVTNRFIWEYANLDCPYRHCRLVDDEPTCIEIMDTSGQLQDSTLGSSVRWGDGFLLVYSIADRNSFDAVSRFHECVSEGRRRPSQHAAPCGCGASFVLVGNKCDLSHERRVTYAEGEQLATDLGCAAFFECSACEGRRQLYDSFYELHRDVVRRRLTAAAASSSSRLNRRRRSSAHQVIQVFNKMFTKING